MKRLRWKKKPRPTGLAAVGAAPYLEGLRDAGVDGVADAISAIEKHGVIRVSEEW